MRNTGEVTGLVDVTFRVGGSFGPGGNMPEEEKRLYEIGPGTTKDIQVTLFEQPRMMTVNTLVSGNIPSAFSTFLRSAVDINTTEIDEYDRISSQELTLELPGEIIVDNEDPGFHFISHSNESKLKKYIESRKEKSNEVFYDGINPTRSPAVWTPLAHTAFFGGTIRSAMLVRSGDGSNTASWSTVLPGAGFYDVYVYIPMSAMFARGDRGRRSGGGNEPGGQSRGGPGGGRPGGRGPRFADDGTIYHYLISSNEGKDEVEFRLRNIEDGWNKIGTFHFPADTAKIQLSNQTNGRRVFADAVKWVRR
jgi:hypothetical protein